MLYKTERIENLDELEAIHTSLYMNAMRLRALLEEPTPSLPQIEGIAKSIHMDALRAKDFEFIVTQRTIKEL